MTLWISHSGDTSGTWSDVTFFSRSGGQEWSDTTTSYLPAGTSKGERGKVNIAHFYQSRVFEQWTPLLPEPSLSEWKCRTEEAPPMVTSWAQSSTGFSNTKKKCRSLKGLQRGCLGKNIQRLKNCESISLTCNGVWYSWQWIQKKLDDMFFRPHSRKKCGINIRSYFLNDFYRLCRYPGTGIHVYVVESVKLTFSCTLCVVHNQGN